MSKRKIIMGKVLTIFLTFLLLTLVLYSVSPALAATAPSLDDADSFAILGGSTVISTGPTVVNGDLGLFPGTSIVGIPPMIVNGAVHATDTDASLAQIANSAAFDALDQGCTGGDYRGTGLVDLVGYNLVPGVYCADSFALTGTLTLSGSGVWIFKSSSTLITSGTANVVGGDPCSVWWRVVSSATLGTGTQLVGNILAYNTITLGSGATLNGRALAQIGAVNLAANTITPFICDVQTTAPTLGKSFSPATINDAGGVSILTITLSNPNPSAAILTASLNDNLPGGLVIASPSNAGTTCIGTGEVSAIAGGSTVTLPATWSIPASSTCTVTVDVTAATEGNYVNTLAAGALQTSNGNNAASAPATLTVGPSTPPPPIPELPTLVLISSGIFGILLMLRKRKD